jgi:hypothetical protein
MQSDVWGTVNASYHTLPVVILLKVQIRISYGHNRHKLFNHTVLLSLAYGLI